MTGRLRVGIVVSHPVQYFSPLFDLLQARGAVDLTVAYGNDAGERSSWDPGFCSSYRWDIDLVSGHEHEFLSRGPNPSRFELAKGLRRLFRLIRGWDVVVINGYATVLTAVAILYCRIVSVPYLLRTDTSKRNAHSYISPRYWWPRRASKWSAGALAVGRKNWMIHERLGCRSIFFAPFAIDGERFQMAANGVRLAQREFREALGLPAGVQIVAYAGKFIKLKRPGDLISIAARLSGKAHFLMIGDGPMMQSLKAASEGLPVTFTGFLNQGAIAEALSCADVIVLPSNQESWGLVVNEAMACGCVPVVSDQVGCAPDLVEGIGEVYRVGDIEALAVAVESALTTARSPDCASRLSKRLEGFSLQNCAAGYEEAIFTASHGRSEGRHGRRRCNA